MATQWQNMDFLKPEILIDFIKRYFAILPFTKIENWDLSKKYHEANLRKMTIQSNVENLA